MANPDTFTVKVDAADAIEFVRGLLEPGAILLPRSAVEELQRVYDVKIAALIGFGGIVSAENCENQTCYNSGMDNCNSDMGRVETGPTRDF